MTTWDEILPTQTNAGKPITQSLMERMRDNPRAVAQGDPTVPPAEKINFPVAMRTDEVDSTARAAPDGVGGVRWIGGGFAGMGADGTGLGSPVAALVAGVYHFEELTVASPQTPTGMVIIFCEGDVDISDTIVSSYRIVIKATGNVSISAAITCRGLEVRCGGNLTISADINAQSGVTPDIEDLNTDTVGVARFYVGGELDISDDIDANDILIFAISDAVISSTLRARWRDSGATSDTEDGHGWPSFDGSGRDNGGDSDVGGDPDGGAGGTGGGYGGGHTGAPTRTPADGFRGGRRLYCIPTNELRRGGGGGSQPSGTGGDGGGRISIYVGGDLDLDGATLNVDGTNGDGVGSIDPAGGAGGCVRVVCLGTINDGTVSADGGTAPGGSAGGGGGGGAFFAATGYTGTQTTSVLGGVSAGGDDGQGGTSITDTLTAPEIAALVAAGVCDV